MTQLLLQINDVAFLPTLKNFLANVKGVKVTEIKDTVNNNSLLYTKAKKLNASVKKNNVTMNDIVSEVRTVRNGKK